jgi:hypothetical protein
MPRRLSKNLQDSEREVAEGIVIRDIPGGFLDPEPIPKGTVVKIARIIRHHAGLSFRIKNGTRWLSEDDLEIKIQPNQIFDYTGKHPDEMVPESWHKKQEKTERTVRASSRIRSIRETPRIVSNLLIPEKETNTEKKEDNGFKKEDKRGKKDYILKTENNNKPKTSNQKEKTMNKNVMRQVLETLTPGATITVAFVGAQSGLSGQYTVIGTRKGRGKGGSLLADLRSPSDELLTIGTPVSDQVLHIVLPDGELHGHESAEDVPPVFETNSDLALSLKVTFKSMIERCEALPRVDTRSRFAPTDRTMVEVVATHPPLNGTFKVREIELKRGRGGKIVMTVEDEGGGTHQIDSFQHSGVISSFTVLT